MSRKNYARLLCSAAAIALASGTAAFADDANFNIAPQSLDTALNAFSEQSAHPVLFKSDMALQKRTNGVTGSTDPELALNQLLQGTGLTWKRAGDTFVITEASDPQSGSAAGGGADQGTVQALIVTAQKREESIQDVPIAMSAFTQEDLTRSQVAGGPDLMTQVPNMTFTKTNFSSYSIQIRGIGTQAISATVDPAVAVAFNNTPFVRNRFFEQEFYDLQRVEVLRGPQGTLYGRNATAGVVNIISAKPSFDFEARLSADVANYNSTRLEGMINLPLAEDVAALRIAGAWTKRDGYSINEITGNPIDGRDLFSTRVSLRFTPTDRMEANLLWEHFQENDDRLRSGKQLCHQDDRTEIAGFSVAPTTGYSNPFSQGCLPASLYSPDSFEAPNGYSLPYYLPLGPLNLPIQTGVNGRFNPYASLTQSRDLRVIESTVDPRYTARSDTAELQLRFDVGDSLTIVSETGYNYDNIFSTQDYNRFNTASGAFKNPSEGDSPRRPGATVDGELGATFCDPQIGCADRLVAVDVSRARSRQISQEFRLSSAFDGPFNFSLGANFFRYDTEDKYYVFINTLSLLAARGGYFTLGDFLPYEQGVTDNRECLVRGGLEPDFNTPQLLGGCIYMDPNPIDDLNDLGHNYFLSRNPYKLISYAVFGEAYYNLTDTLKVTAGLRWTVDKKEAPRIPSWVLGSDTLGYPVLAVERQEWREPTGRLTIDWKPDFAFTDETLLYASYAHGYKAGGSNPPPSGIVSWGNVGLGGAENEIGRLIMDQSVTKPKTFDPEFVNAFELGSKNTLLGGDVTLNVAAFYYDYKAYQTSQIIDRSAVNYNFDAKVWGLELESDWRPIENLRLGLKLGYENTRLADGESAIDIMDRTAGNPDWAVVRPFPSYPSNCILPLYTLTQDHASLGFPNPTFYNGYMGMCERAYVQNVDPMTNLPYVPNPTVTALSSPIPVGYPGFNPDTAPNNGEGFAKDLGGNELPNAPHFTGTITADYTLPLPSDWLMTLHTDLYYQSEAWTRVFNTEGYDKLKAYTNVNLAAIFTNEDAGWKVMAYVKNVFDRDSITGAFLNSDDTGLTTNVFLTEPRLFGLRVTKEWNGRAWWADANPNHRDGVPYRWTVELGGQLQRFDTPNEPAAAAFTDRFQPEIDPRRHQNEALELSGGGEAKVTYAAANGWRVAGGMRYSRTKGGGLWWEHTPDEPACLGSQSYCDFQPQLYYVQPENWQESRLDEREEYVMADFTVGRDVGLGGLTSSQLSGGIRYAQLASSTRQKIDAVPDWDLPAEWALYDDHHHRYKSLVNAEREFQGVGPVFSWDASRALLDLERGRVDLDWSLSGGVLFGKQSTDITGSVTDLGYTGKYWPSIPHGKIPETVTTTPIEIHRSSSTTVPVAAGSLGLSFSVNNFKIGGGYRWERYFDAVDGGMDEGKDFDRTLDGPYLKLSLGFGG